MVYKPPWSGGMYILLTPYSLGFKTTRFDSNVWVRKRQDPGEPKMYKYICSHVNNFMIVDINLSATMEQIQKIYNIKFISPPKYYLGNDYKRDKLGRWCIGCKKYIHKAVSQAGTMFGKLQKHDNPSKAGNHPETDNTDALLDTNHQKYQTLVGMLVWIVTIGQLDVAHAMSSLSQFLAHPREGHLKCLLQLFGYLKKKTNKRIIVDSCDSIHVGGKEALEQNLVEELADLYPDLTEEVDVNLPKPLVEELEITCFDDSNHAHGQISRHSIMGMIIFVGRTPVFYSSKQQGAIKTSTYGAEFCAMRCAVKEVMAIQYMLWAL